MTLARKRNTVGDMRSLILAAILLLPANLFSQTAGAASGRIISLDGTPVSEVRVIALETSYPRSNIASQTQTDSDGRFRLDTLDAGEYFIVADPFKRPSFYPGVANRDDAKRVTVTAGEVLKNLDFRFVVGSGVIQTLRASSPGVSMFSGILHDVLGKPQPNVTVALSDTQTKTRHWTATDATGTFKFSNLKAGEYSVSTFSPEFDWSRGNAGTEELTLLITLATNESLSMELGLRRFGNFDQRPDLYARLPERQKEESSINVPEAIFWRLQKLDEQEQPSSLSLKGSVDVQLRINSNGELLWIRAASRTGDPELARTTVEILGRWKFTGLRMTANSPRQMTTDQGDPIGTLSTLRFTYPSAR